MVPRDRATISLFCTKQAEGKKALRKKQLYWESTHVSGNPVQSQRRKANIGTLQESSITQYPLESQL